MTGIVVQDTTNLLNAIARGAEALSCGAGWPDGMETLLAELGNVTGVSRVFLFQVIDRGEDYIVQDYIAEWVGERKYALLGDDGLSMFRTERSEPEYWAIHESRKAGSHHAIIVSELPDCKVRRLLEGQGVRSMLTIPLMVDGRQWGVLGLDDCEREYRWSESEVALLRTASSLLTNSILHARLHARQQQFDILKRFTDCFAWELDLKRMLLWISGDLSGEPGGRELYLTMNKAFRMVHPRDRRALTRAVNEHIASGEKTFRHDVRLYRPGGGWTWAEIIGSLERTEHGELRQFAGIVVDIRRRKVKEMKLQEQACRDPLTGAANRRTFERNLSFYVDRARSEAMDLALLAVDFDRFKEINDTWGHPVGDMVLKKFVRISEQCLRGGDVLARIGGEEFVVLLPGAGMDSAVRVGERIREAVADLGPLLEAGSIGFTISIGCAIWDDAMSRPDDLLEAADKALYEAKHAGRNRLVCHSGDCPLPSTES
ncbi:sensor domain-containing diguanylate cyclase [Salidesulfovibrio onnuriiensis]|uniref:sensor domain-containing diguanylate cyclase n=1 Tax=Salidesulfovibrio onnuriiensis TaxID=2583823 RepID=UPI0011CCD9C4|nr:sensor domain-containing diguanylate cyclase [Salidesulfovibrio onnuriiensis]